MIRPWYDPAVASCSFGYRFWFSSFVGVATNWPVSGAPILGLLGVVCRSYAAEINSPTYWTLVDSPVRVDDDLRIVEGASLQIDPGVTIELAAGVSIQVEGQLFAQGASGQPILFTSAASNTLWGGLVLAGRPDFHDLSVTGRLAYCRFEEATWPATAPFAGKAAILAQYSNVSVSNCTFTSLPSTVLQSFDGVTTVSGSVFEDCGEGVNVVRCKASIVSNQFFGTRNGADAIDVDLEYGGVGRQPVRVEANIVSGSSGDGIDLGGSAAYVAGNLIRDCADKGLSLGEGSSARVENNVILHCSIGVAIKDSSAPVMANNTIVHCETGIHAFEKNLGHGGGRGHCVNSVIWDCGRSVVMDSLSVLDVQFSAVQGSWIWPGAGNTTNDPTFVDLPRDDIRLSPVSPLLGVGTMRASGALDYHGVSRGDPPSIGSFETADASPDTDRDGLSSTNDLFPLHPLYAEDSDDDGLPDRWELTYFQNLSATAAGDPDMDGMSNYGAFEAGLNPTNRELSILLNEIMYHPQNDVDADEYVELYNHSSASVSLAGWQLVDEVVYTFPVGTVLGPGAHLVVAGDPARVEATYGIAGVLGPWDGSLSDDGAVLRLVNARQAMVDAVRYSPTDGWPVGADGNGASLELRDPEANNAAAANWSASLVLEGTPGARNSAREGPVVINEFLAQTDAGVSDWIELYNQSSTNVDLAGWYLSDDADDLTSWAIPAPTVLAAGAVILFQRSDFGFGLSGEGEGLFLTRPDGQTIESSLTYLDQQPDVSQGRYPNGSLQWTFYAPGGSPGHTNSPPPVPAQVVLNEIMYHPATENDLDEYVELFNAGTTDVDLTRWAFADGFSYMFPSGTVMTAGSHLVIGHNPVAVGELYGLTNVLGPFLSGRLSNRGERLRLVDEVGRVVDEVYYQDRGGWPRDADGEGPSLALRHPDLDNGVAASWTTVGTGVTPGEANGGSNDSSAIVFCVGHFPVTPTSTEAVTVRARVAGAAQVILHWKTDDDTAFQVSPLTTNAAGIWVGQIPPQADRSLMEYYVGAVDSSGSTNHHPEGAPELLLAETGNMIPHTLRYLCLDMSPDPGVPALRVLMPDETRIELLSRDLFSNDLLPVTLVYGEEVYPFARLRFRGLTKRQWPVKSYRLDLRNDHPFLGKTRLNVNGKRPGPEWLANAFAQNKEFAVPQLLPIRLYVNHEDRGPYLLAERTENDFLERSFYGASNGEFYEGWGQEAVSNYPVAVAAVLGAASETGRVNYVDHLQVVTDPTQWIEWLSLTALLGDHETLLNENQRNHACYLHPGTGRLMLLPLDLDATWNPAAAAASLHMTRVNMSTWPLGLSALDAFMFHPPLRRLYYQALAADLDICFSARLTSAIQRHFDVIDPSAQSLPEQGSVASTLSYINLRAPEVERQMSNLVHATTGVLSRDRDPWR